jgi:SAM-dependent methyltransferase
MPPLLKRLKGALKPLLPRPVLDARTRWIVARQRREFSRLTVEDTFARIYATNAWGGERGEYDSGDGSANAVTQSYVSLVRDFVKERGIRSIVDLGCGDFRVGRQLLAPGLSYVGVDIVQPLVARNQREFARDGVRFEQRNLLEDELPQAELGLLRQVLQHLSNAQIERVLTNCKSYRYLLVTEHLPVGNAAVPNLDKPHGPDIRLYDRSGVFLDLPPFSRKVRVLLDAPIAPGEVLRSVLIEQEVSPVA